MWKGHHLTAPSPVTSPVSRNEFLQHRIFSLLRLGCAVLSGGVIYPGLSRTRGNAGKYFSPLLEVSPPIFERSQPHFDPHTQSFVLNEKRPTLFIETFYFRLRPHPPPPTLQQRAVPSRRTVPASSPMAPSDRLPSERLS